MVSKKVAVGLALLALLMAGIAVVALQRAVQTAPAPGNSTLEFRGIINGQATMGVPTWTPGLKVEELRGTAIQEALVSPTPTPSRTPQPTHTSIPSFATEAWMTAQAVRAANGEPPLQPGPSREEQLATAVELLLSATPRP